MNGYVSEKAMTTRIYERIHSYSDRRLSKFHKIGLLRLIDKFAISAPATKQTRTSQSKNRQLFVNKTYHQEEGTLPNIKPGQKQVHLKITQADTVSAVVVQYRTNHGSRTHLSSICLLLHDHGKTSETKIQLSAKLKRLTFSVYKYYHPFAPSPLGTIPLFTFAFKYSTFNTFLL